MTTTTELTHRPAGAEALPVTVPQYSKRAILAVWAAAALPMGAMAWIVAPRLASTFEGPAPLTRALIICLTAGLVWQFVLVMALVGREQRTLRWSTLREALWLRSPQSPRTGRVGGRMWLIVVPMILAMGAEELIPSVQAPVDRDFGLFLGSDAGEQFISGAWGWFALILVMLVFNTVLGEELLFRGFLLPRMNGAFGDRDWVANGVLFALYHLPIPWAIPAILVVDTGVYYAVKRYRSAWIGIAAHSAQTVVFAVLLLTLVLK